MWVATAYLLKHPGNRRKSLVTAVPATFMSAVSLTYILMAKEGFGLGKSIAYPAGILFALGCFVMYLLKRRNLAVEIDDEDLHKNN